MTDPTRVQDVVLGYRMRGGTWVIRTLSPAEYYEPGVLTKDSIERHDHAVDFLDVDQARLEATRLTVRSIDGQRSVTETFWNDGRSRIIERSDTGEVIVDTWIDGGRHIVRLVRREGELHAVSDTVFRNDR